MTDTAHPSSFVLLGLFADFYEEIAKIKLDLDAGRMPTTLASAGESLAEISAPALAGRVSSRLFSILQKQSEDFRRRATTQEIKTHDAAQYLMAALADEIFILEFKWKGGEAWVDVLLEHKLRQSRNAGWRFFELADQLVKIQSRAPSYVDLAAVFLLALKLGFKGRYRGQEGTLALRRYRQELYRLVNPDSQDRRHAAPAFEQAYLQQISGHADERLAPISSWYALGKKSLRNYLIVSTIVWFVLVYPFNHTFG
jgi:type VI secretion system protein ImpK